MKQFFTILCSFVFTYQVVAQTNTFPTTGNVGIGTTAPTEKLEISGNAFLNGTSPKLRFNYSNVAAFSTGIFGEAQDNSRYSISSSSAGEVFSVKYLNGNVGIGTTTPATKLQVAGDIMGQNRLIFLENNSFSVTPTTVPTLTSSSFSMPHYGIAGAATTSGGDLWLAGYNAIRMFNSGNPIPAFSLVGQNLGLGTTNPSSKLDVRGDVQFGVNSFVKFVDTGGANGRLVFGNIGSIDATTAFLFRNGTGTNEYMRISPSGNIAIGTNTDSGYKLDVNGNTRISGYLRLNDNLALDNNKFIYWKDVAGTDRRFLGLASNNSLYLGDIDNIISGGVNNFFAKQQHNFFVDNDLKIQLANGDNYFKGNIQSYGVLNPQLSTRSNDATPIIGKIQSVNGNSVYLGSESNHNVNFITNNSIQATINTDGNVGIGTATPENSEGWHKVLDVYGSSHSKIIATTANVQTGIWSHNFGFYNSPPGGILGTKTNHPLSFITNGTNKLTITNDGNVGIGTANPSQKLEVNGSLKVSGSIYSGEYGSNTSGRDDASLQGNAGATSGFFQTANPVNYPKGASSWWHLIDTRHSNPANNYAMQMAGSFFDQKFYVRKTNNNPSQPWRELVTTDANGKISFDNDAYANKSPIIIGGSVYGAAIRLNANSTVAGNRNLDLGYTDNTGAFYSSIVINSETGNVGIGTSTPPTGYKLAVAGDVIAERIVVKLQSAWPDYVFSTGYPLKPLVDVESYLKEHKHLPDVPSEQEVKEKGVDVTQMNAVLLKKIEELTLYMIDLKKQNDELQKRVNAIEQK